MTEAISHTKKSTCAACGTSPVNHTLTYTTAIIDDVLGGWMRFFFGWIHVPREGMIANAVNAGFVGVFRLVGLARMGNDIELAASGRSKLIWQEASDRGIPMQQIIMFGRPLEQYRAKIGGRWTYFQSIPVPDWLPQKGYDWIDDKFKLASRLKRAGINAPAVQHAGSLRGAKRAFAKLEKPLIVKPRSGSRGRHTTTNIRTMDELVGAYKLAEMISPSMVIEEHLYGSVYRATVIDGKLVGFFRADPPQVTGDGKHTIAELVELKNAKRAADGLDKLADIDITDDTRSFIGRYGYAPNSTLPAGMTLDLSAKTGRMYGGYTREMLPEVHPKMHGIFAQAGKTVAAAIVGFDLIIPDPTTDPDTQKWGIIECNSLPFIDLHYYALEGKPINLAKNIWDLWENRLKK